jgi:hypothetical protein
MLLVGWLVLAWFGLAWLGLVWFGWLVGDHLLIRDFESYGIIFMNACVVINNHCNGMIRNHLMLRHTGLYAIIL